MSENRTDSPAPAAPEPLLPPRVREALDRVKSVWTRLPFAAKLFLVSAGATVLVVSLYFAAAPAMREYAVLYGQLEGEDAGVIVEKLKAQKIPFELTGDGTTIKIPKDKVHEVRLQLASEGLPKGGHIGFESFENMRLGATEFEQQVVYRRAMEGELARTIATVRSVQSARVHLVLPKASVFAQKKEAATASVVVKLRGSRIEEEEIGSIVNLVASAVQGLEPDRVTLVTTDGRMLHRPRPVGADGETNTTAAEQDLMAQRRGVEALLEERTRTMLERVLGPGHVDVRITAELDRAKVETTTDKFDHSRSSMRSEQQLVEQSATGAPIDNTVAGVPGAEGALPDGADAGGAGQDGAGGTLRKQSTRNYEIDRVQERRISVTQNVKRLAVAVVIDGIDAGNGSGNVVARAPQELEKLTLLVRSAVGFDEDRGDVVTVESVPFYMEKLPEPEAEVPLIPLPESFTAKYGKFLPLAKVASALLVATVVLLVSRRALRRRGERLEVMRLKELESQERIVKMQLEAAKVEPPPPPEVVIDYRAEALKKATEDPATAALVLRYWLKSYDLPQAQPSPTKTAAA
ncbi:MAG: flagellar M-ring protein FliF [Deltaproteobacteria bacterium]|nr:flagellar M-ring protein FliF [Deltaproteobacteria bacterium]